MWKYIGSLVLSCIVINTYAGFETPQEQQAKRLAERLIETKQYTDSIVGKTAWYTPQGVQQNQFTLIKSACPTMMLHMPPIINMCL